MGITWRSAMPLLSTLAALVIIVHSAEENLEREHRERRYDLRPRLLDTRPSDNEQPWRVVQAEPTLQQLGKGETWNNDPQDEPPVRRRLGRKRKRRPPAPSNDAEPLKMTTSPDEENDEVNVQDSETGTRRKNVRPNRWIETDIGRPIRRRGQRRKRPSLDNSPELSEFGGYHRANRPREKDRQINIRTEIDDEDVSEPRDYYSLKDDYGENEMRHKIRRPVSGDYLDKERAKIRRPVSSQKYVIAQENGSQEDKHITKEDKSLSEFSMEVMGHSEALNTDDEFVYIDDKLREKSPRVFLDLDKAQEKSLTLELDKYFDFRSDYVSFIITPGTRNKKTSVYTIKELIEEVKSRDKIDDSIDFRKLLLESNNSLLDLPKKIRDKLRLQPYLDDSSTYLMEGELKREQAPIDPITLKDILKRSNGTSLSEILQQHNLTLADLLNGKENAIAVLKSEKILQSSKKSLYEDRVHTTKSDQSMEINDKVNITSDSLRNDIISEYKATHTNQNTDNYDNFDKENTNNTATTNKYDESLLEQAGKENNGSISLNNDKEVSDLQNEDQKLVALENRNSGIMIKRRFPSIRRKLRMRPMVNNTFKSQINRDLIALSARRYIHHNRKNATKSKEWREMIPLMIDLNTTENQEEHKENILVTTTSVPEETTIAETTIVNDVINQSNVTETENEGEGLSTEVTEPTTITIEIFATEMDVNVTERPILSRPNSNAAGLRRQAFNNRLKKKRIKQKTSTTEAPHDDIMKNLLEMGDLVSSSEFIARTQLPKVTRPNNNMETVTELEDFLTTETTSKITSMKSTRYPSTREFVKSSTVSGVTQAPLIISTEETAKIEIEEILNDTRTSANLSKILKERNMTLNELLDHRERGSSHVHLADIFHNASREPNPPEPFLSKSLLEPISKETYPLRAILEANSHEQATKATTVDPIYTNHLTIPVIMDFGNNVNENAENMGIMSLFNNFTKETTLPDIEKSTIQQDSKGTPYKSTIIAVNATDDGDMIRESRMLNDDQDMISWNEIFSMIRRNQKNETKALEKVTNELVVPPETYKKVILEEDVDGDGLIILEDLQHLRDTDKKVTSGSEEKTEFNSYEGTETPVEPGILSKTPSSAKSVTVATASIVGLAMILFLLTYAALKWKQQRTIGHKKSFGDERIPSPVFENRKIKKNCSSRSISPMLPTSNIYTMNTMESQTGKDSPEYMWDTLRKPFQ